MSPYAQRYAQFLESKQPPVSLRIAMEDFFRPDLPETYRETYGKYLQKRIRSLAEQLIEQEDLEKLEAVEQLGWLTPALVDLFCKMAARKHKQAALVWLLARKQEKYGFAAQNFDL